MNKKWLSLFIALNLIINVQALVIKGKVADAQTKEAIQAVSIFISGSTSGTVSGTDGFFSLSIPQKGASKMILTHMNYETRAITIDDSSNIQFITIKLQPKIHQLAEIGFTGRDANRKQNLKQFLFSFLGESSNGKRCRLLNPEVLHFRRQVNPENAEEYMLTATADSALIIENKALGYQINYTLLNFKLTSTRMSYKGYPLFIDLLDKTKPDQTIVRARVKAFKGSTMHFMRCLFNQNLTEEGFEIYPLKIVKDVSTLKHGLLSDTSLTMKAGYHLVQTEKQLYIKNDINPSVQVRSIKLNQPIEVRYTREKEEITYILSPSYYKDIKSSPHQQTSIIWPLDGSLIFYPDGSYKNPDQLVTIGYWSYLRIGDTLPWDYYPKQ